MRKATKNSRVLLMIFAFAFIYRLFLMMREGYPPGADIGLHNSVIHSISGNENINLFNNFYHMGGGLSLTFPGYHIFATNIILMTGLPEYLAHAMITSLFSSLIVLTAFLLTKLIWSEAAGFIAAFLVIISRFDIEMLLWGGYPNVITLLLIPTIFYLYLQRNRFSSIPFVVSIAILSGSMFITHSLSAILYFGMILLTTLIIFIKPNLFSTTRKRSVYWLVPVTVGILIFAPFIIQAIPQYLQSNSTLSEDPVSSNAIKAATITTRTLPLGLVLPLFGIIPGFLFFSKKYFNKYLTPQTLLLLVWVLLPLILTQAYLIGFSVDYNRFLYFLILPLIIFIGVLIQHGSDFFADKIEVSKNNFVSSTKHKHFIHLSKKEAYSGFVLLFLLLAFFVIPIFMSPAYNYQVGLRIQEFYQTMDNQGWEALQWIKTNTPTDSVFVSDALYGWWLGGFAQRKTLSAVDPQFLSINEEYNKTLFARTLLDTNYLVDNGLIQVREDGGYISRHNPEILSKLNWTYFPHTFFVFDSNETSIDYNLNGNNLVIPLSSLSVKEMKMNNYNHCVTISVIRGNENFNYSQFTTIYKGSRFVNLTSTIDSTSPDFILNRINIIVQTKGEKIFYEKDDLTLGFFDEPMKVHGQLIFINTPKNSTVDDNDKHRRVFLEYDKEKAASIQIIATAYSVSNNPINYDTLNRNQTFFAQMTSNLNYDRSINEDSPEWEQVFDYKSEILYWNISYIVCPTSEKFTLDMFSKFQGDQLFDLVFFNHRIKQEQLSNGTYIDVIREIGIFKVNGSKGTYR